MVRFIRSTLQPTSVISASQRGSSWPTGLWRLGSRVARAATPWAAPGVPTRLVAHDDPRFGQPVATLVDLVFGDAGQQALLTVRLDGFLDALGPAGLTKAQGRIASLVAHRVEAIVRNTFRELEDWQTTLRAMANQLGQLELRSKRAVVDEMGVEPGALPLPRERGDEDELGREGG